MRTLLIFAVSLMAGALVSAQTAEEKVVLMKQTTGQEVSEVTPDTSPGRWNLYMGTGFTSWKGYGSGMNFYAAPTYTITLKNRWSLQGGVVATRYQGLFPAAHAEGSPLLNHSGLAVYGAASYRMNDRIVLHGAGVKQLLAVPVTPLTPYPLDDLSLGATFNLGNGLSIGAAVHMRKGPLYGYPVQGTGSPSPLFW